MGQRPRGVINDAIRRFSNEIFQIKNVLRCENVRATGIRISLRYIFSVLLPKMKSLPIER